MFPKSLVSVSVTLEVRQVLAKFLQIPVSAADILEAPQDRAMILKFPTFVPDSPKDLHDLAEFVVFLIIVTDFFGTTVVSR